MGYLETIGAYACKNNNYLDSVEKGCENVEPEREKGYLGWFLNLAECLEAYPSPRKGFTFNNVETRSVWLYDGAHWRNTTQGNPFHLIYDIEHAGEVKKGYAQTFYYIPTEEDVRGGTITFHFLIDGKDMWVECDVEYLSDIVFIEWNGSVFVSRVRSLDDRVAYVDSGKVVDRAGNVVVDVADIEDKINNGLKEIEDDLSELQQAHEQFVEDVDAVTEGLEKMIIQTKDMLDEGDRVLNEAIVREKERAQVAEQSLEQGLWELQDRTQSAASELNRRIEEEKNRAEGVEQELEGGLKEAVKYTPQDIGANAREQARYNIRAVGYRGTYGNTVVLEANGEIRYPEGRATSIKMSNGVDNVENVLIETKEKVDTFLADADTSEQAIDKLKELQEYIKNDETSASQMLGDIAQNRQDIAKEVTRAKQVEMYLESQKADKTGYYENMSVGVSDNLSGRGESSNAEFAMRPSGGKSKSIPEDGTARINSIHGNSVIWNQLIKNVYSSTSKDGWVARSGASFCSIENGTIKLFYDPNSQDLFRNQLIQKVYVENGDKFFLSYNFKSNNIDKYNNSVHIGFTDGWSNRNWGVTAEMKGKGLGNSGYVSGISTFTGDYSDDLKICIWFANPENSAYNTEIDYTTPLEITNFRFINLTKMFGKGNEPTTVEEFELLYGNMSDDFNEGTIIDNHTKAIKSVGINAWDEEWENGAFNDSNGLQNNYEKNRVRCKNKIEVLPNTNYTFEFPIKGTGTSYFNILWYNENDEFIKFTYKTQSSQVAKSPSNAKYMRFYMGELYGNKYTNDICIHLTHTGYLNGKYFPYEDFVRELPTVDGGLKSALNAYDEIRYNVSKDKWEYVKRIGVVDLGTLNWKAWNLAVNEVQHLRFSAKMGEKFNGSVDNSRINNIINKRYHSISMADTWNYKKGISMSYKSATIKDKEFIIYDDAYTVDDAAKLKSDLSGVICYYELEEPIVTELDTDISPDYKVWDYGTEEAINSELSTPVKLNLNYGFNAVGQITDNTILIEELLARVAQLEAQIAQVNSVSDTNEEE